MFQVPETAEMEDRLQYLVDLELFMRQAEKVEPDLSAELRKLVALEQLRLLM